MFWQLGKCWTEIRLHVGGVREGEGVCTSQQICRRLPSPHPLSLSPSMSISLTTSSTMSLSVIILATNHRVNISHFISIKSNNVWPSFHRVTSDLCWIALCLCCCQMRPTPQRSLTSPHNSSIKGGKGGLKLRFVLIERKSRRISLPPNRRRNEGNLERANPRISGAVAAAAATKEGCLGIAGQLVMGWRELCLNVIIWR